VGKVSSLWGLDESTVKESEEWVQKQFSLVAEAKEIWT